MFRNFLIFRKIESTFSSGPKSLTQPPTPPPIERIPGYQDDSSLRGSSRGPGPGNVLRRKSNPEAMHLGLLSGIGVNGIMHLAEHSSDSSALSRSTSAIAMGKFDRMRWVKENEDNSSHNCRLPFWCWTICSIAVLLNYLIFRLID